MHPDKPEEIFSYDEDLEGIYIYISLSSGSSGSGSTSTSSIALIIFICLYLSSLPPYLLPIYKHPWVGDDRKDAIRDAIKEAQDTAIELSNNVTFADKYSILVSVHDAHVPNVTLVDLPGFTNVDDESQKICYEIVSKYMDMPGTLVLHVVKMDGDFDTVLGNDFVRKKELKNKILVLTHADALEKFDYEKTIKPRVRDIVSKTSEPRFAILGSFEGAHEEELLQMKKFNCLQNQHDINIGTSALNLCIEETITDHLHSQWPIAKDIIRKNLRETEEALEKVKIIHPLDILVALRGEILDNFKEQKSQLELNSIRVWMKKLKNGINGFNLEDPKVESKELDDYDVIEDGTRVRVKFLANAVGGVVPPPFIKECIITKFDPKTSLYVVHVADKPLEIHSKVPRKDICSLIENNPSKFLTHLKELLGAQHLWSWAFNYRLRC